MMDGPTDLYPFFMQVDHDNFLVLKNVHGPRSVFTVFQIISIFSFYVITYKGKGFTGQID